MPLYGSSNPGMDTYGLAQAGLGGIGNPFNSTWGYGVKSGYASPSSFIPMIQQLQNRQQAGPTITPFNQPQAEGSIRPPNIDPILGYNYNIPMDSMQLTHPGLGGGTGQPQGNTIIQNNQQPAQKPYQPSNAGMK